MRLKRYTAPTTNDALKLIKKELGPDAVILSTRKVKGADGNMAMEVTAAVEREAPAKAHAPDVALPQAEENTAPANDSKLDYILQEHGVANGVARKVTRAADALADTGFSTEDALEMVLSKLVHFAPPAHALKQGRATVFIGPTGAGKTTTLAKLAVNKRMNGFSVGLINMDTYKIGGQEQLQIYADALKEKALQVNSAEGLKDALDTFTDKDFIFIDTGGVNPFETGRLDDMLAMLEGADVDIALVLPCNLNTLELTRMPKAFAALKPSVLLFSKMDETAHLGGILNAAVESELFVCYATDGQRVPQDLLELDAQSLGRRLSQPPRLPWEESA
mgnify:CR=1 FL=1